MKKQLIFIDDSGDPGVKTASSDIFVMAAVLFTDPEVAEALMHEIGEYRESLGWKNNHEFKFTKNPKNIVLEMLGRANKYDFKVYAVYIEKNNFREITPALVPFFDREKLYNWMIKELLKEIAPADAKITIDGRSSRQYKKDTTTYLRREIKSGNSSKIEFKFEDSVRTDLLQLADLVAGSVNRSLQLNKTDVRKYISVFRNKIVKIRKITFR